MSTVSAAKKRILLHGTIRLVVVVVACCLVVVLCPPAVAWSHLPLLILLAVWAGLESYIAVQLFKLNRFLGALVKTEPEQVSITTERVRGVPVICVQGAFAPPGATPDMYEVHSLSKDYARDLVAGKEELLVTAFRGVDARTPCVAELNGKPIVMVPSTRKRDEAAFCYAKAYHYLQQPDAAIAELSKAIDYCGDHMEARVLRANLLMQRQEYEAAIDDLTEAIRNSSVDKDYVYAYAMRGCAYYSIEKFKEASEDFCEVLKRKPDNNQYRVQRGYSYYHLGMINNAIEDLTAAIAVQPDDYKVRSALANIYTGKGDPVKALSLADDASCDAASNNPPEHKLLLVSRGLAQGAMHRRDAAIASFSRAIELDPYYEFALRCRAAQYMQGPDGPRLAEQDLLRAEVAALANESDVELPNNGANGKGNGPHADENVNKGITRGAGKDLDPHHTFADKVFGLLIKGGSLLSSVKLFWDSAQSVGKAVWCLVAACLIAYIEMLPMSFGQPLHPMIALAFVLLWFVAHLAGTAGILRAVRSQGQLSDTVIVFCYSLAAGLVLCSWIQSVGLFLAVNVAILGCLYGIESKHKLKGTTAMLAVLAPIVVIISAVLLVLVLTAAHH